MELDPRELERLEKLAKPVQDNQLPNVFLGELQEFNWGIETCVLGNGRPGIRLVIMPALLPFIKFALPLHVMGAQKLVEDLQLGISTHYAHYEQNESLPEG